MKIIFDIRDYLERVWAISEKISFDGSANSQFIGSMLFSTLNICDAMQLLIEKRNFVSSNILLRSLYEYMFRSFWLNRVAEFEDIQRCMKEDKWPATAALHTSIKGMNEIIDLLAAEKVKIQSILNSYIHGGSQNPLSQLGDDNYITPNIPDTEVIYLLQVVQLCSYVILCESIYLSNTNEFDSEVEVMGNNLLSADDIS
ncbi:MAG TPA: DUF5677 domain-containing protein [Cellvibrio sp.]